MILYFAYISFILLALKLINTTVNFILKDCITKLKSLEKNSVSVLIPARNEEKNIRLLLKDLQKIEDSILEILIYNDESTDNTEKVINELSKHDKRIKLIKTFDLPQGWMGKNHACHRLSEQAKGKYFLFIDADVRMSDNIIDSAIAFMEQKKLKLLSIFPVQILKTLGEKCSVPLINYVLLSLLPLILVRTSKQETQSAAIGQFMLFEADTYNKIKPHRLLKNSFVEDIHISRLYKRKQLNMACLIGDKRIKCRMYNSYWEALHGFSRNVFMFFGNFKILAFLFWLFATFGIVSVAIALPQYLLVYLSGGVLMIVLYAATAKQNILLSIILFPILLVFMLQVMITSVISKIKKRNLWKERNIF